MEKENSGSAQLDPQSGVFKKRVEKTADILFDTATVTIYFLNYDYSGIGSDGFCFSAQINTICVLGAGSNIFYWTRCLSRVAIAYLADVVVSLGA